MPWKNTRTYSSAMTAVLGVVGILMFGVAFYFGQNYSGPYRWLAELQLNWFGEYDEHLTLLLTAFGLAIPFIILERMLGTRRNEETIGHSNVALIEESKLAKPKVRIPHLLWVGLILIAIGVREHATGHENDQLQIATIEEFETKRRPASSFLDLSGIPQWNAAVHFDQGSTSSSYVPLVSVDWKPSQRVAVFLYLRRSEFDVLSRKQGRESFHGILPEATLPGPVRVHFDQSDYRPMDGSVMFTVGGVPSSTGDAWILFSGAGVTLASLIYYGWKRRRAGRFASIENAFPTET